MPLAAFYHTCQYRYNPTELCIGAAQNYCSFWQKNFKIRLGKGPGNLKWMLATRASDDFKLHLGRGAGVKRAPYVALAFCHTYVKPQNSGEAVVFKQSATTAAVCGGPRSSYIPLLVQGLNARQKRRLGDLPFVPVANATRLAAPSQLFVRLSEDLAPFAFEVPVHLVAHLPLLRELGVADGVSTAKLISLLQVATPGRSRAQQYGCSPILLSPCTALWLLLILYTS